MCLNTAEFRPRPTPLLHRLQCKFCHILTIMQHAIVLNIRIQQISCENSISRLSRASCPLLPNIWHWHLVDTDQALATDKGLSLQRAWHCAGCWQRMFVLMSAKVLMIYDGRCMRLSLSILRDPFINFQPLLHITLFPDLSCLEFLIAFSIASDQKLEAGEGLGTRLCSIDFNVLETPE